MNQNKKIKIILVEGNSDIAFLNLLLIKWKKCKYIEVESDRPFAFSKGEWYESKNNYVLICASGGVDYMNAFYRKYLKVQLEDNQKIDSIIVIVDADDKSQQEIENSIKFDKIKFIANQPNSFTIIDGFGERKKIDSFLKIIPNGKSGALENVLLDSIEVDDPVIVKESKKFVDGLPLEGKKHLEHKRMLLKAKTGVVFSLLKPDKTFCELREKFKLVNYKTQNILDNFGFLNDFIK